MLLTMGSLASIAQRASIKGYVTDTVSGLKLRDAVVLLANSKDSMLVQFCRTDANGYFKMDRNLVPGQYIICVSLPSYVDYVELKELSGNVNSIDISLFPKSKLLKAVVVKGKVKAISLNGDTLEFKADAYHVGANASVDELFRQLPGFQVDRGGKISVNGQAVQKILVDGEEFFSDDPTLVSKTVRADMVDKVQVFDKKSEQAAFAGVQDGKTAKAINLKLKEDKKKGYFGKLIIGGGDRYYNGSGMFNRFKGPAKFSVYAIASNTGEGDISWKDREDFGVAKDLEYNTPLQTLDSWAGQYAGLGFPQLYTAGAHYNNKWNAFNQAIGGEARVAKLNLSENMTSTTISILPTQKLTTSGNEKNYHILLQQKYNGNYQVRLDSMTELKAKIGAAVGNKTGDRNIASVIRNEAGLSINELSQYTNTDERSNSWMGELIVNKRFRKAGRLLTLGLSGAYNTLNGNGTFITNNLAWDRENTDTSVNLDTRQYKETASKQDEINLDVLYRFPISQTSALSLKYAMALGNMKSQLTTFNIGSDGKNKSIDSIYSNNYLFRSVGNKAGIHYHFVKKQFQLEAGNDIGLTSFNQTDYFRYNLIKRNFVGWFPNIELKYSGKNGTRTASLSYLGNTILPSALQLQPLANNTDPNNIIIGNPQLGPSYSNTIKLLYINADFIARKTTWIDIGCNLITGDFTTADQIDSIGRKKYQFINGDYTTLWTGNATYSFPLAKSLTMGVSAGWNLRSSMNIVNNAKNRIRNGNYVAGLFFSESLPEKLNITLNVNPSYNYNSSSVAENSGADYWMLDTRLQATVYFPLKSELHTSCSLLLRQKTDEFTDNTNVVLWDIWINKRLLKSEALILKLSATDVLNQAKSVFRYINTNYISEYRYDVIKRYFQVGLTWNFSNFNNSAKP